MFESVSSLPGSVLDDPLEGVWPELAACRPVSDDECAAWCAAQEPSVEVVAALTSLHREQLTDAGRIDAVLAWERVATWAQAQTLAPLVDLVGVQPVDPASATDAASLSDVLEQSACTEDAQVALRLSDVVMRHRLVVARELTTRLPATYASLRAGRITWWHALALAESVHGVDDRIAELVEHEVLPAAERGTLANTRRAIQRALTRHDAQGVADRHEAGKAVSDVVSWPEPDGLAVLQVRGTALEVARLQRVVDQAAAREPEDGRMIGRRRVEALVGLLCRSRTDHGARTSEGVQVQVVVDLPTLSGLADNPAVIPGYGPVPAPIAREWAADASSWRRLVVDPVTGALLDYGRTRYRPPPGVERPPTLSTRCAVRTIGSRRSRAGRCCAVPTVPQRGRVRLVG